MGIRPQRLFMAHTHTQRACRCMAKQRNRNIPMPHAKSACRRHWNNTYCSCICEMICVSPCARPLRAYRTCACVLSMWFGCLDRAHGYTFACIFVRACACLCVCVCILNTPTEPLPCALADWLPAHDSRTVFSFVRSGRSETDCGISLAPACQHVCVCRQCVYYYYNHFFCWLIFHFGLTKKKYNDSTPCIILVWISEEIGESSVRMILVLHISLTVIAVLGPNVERFYGYQTNSHIAI